MSSINSRKIRLFGMLHEENNYRPTSYFAKVLGVSEKTIYNDILELNELLDEYQLEIIKIPRKGIILEGDLNNISKFKQRLKEQNELVIVNYSPAFRRLKLLELLLLKEKQESIEMLADRFSVGVDSLLKDIKEIQSVFSNFDVHLSQSNNYFQVEGSENNIQKAFTQYLIISFENDFSFHLNINDDSLISLIGTIFDSTIVSLAIDAINKIVKTTKHSIEEYYETSLFITLLVQVSRIKIDCHINDFVDNLIFENLKVFEPYLIAVDIANEFEKRIGLGFTENDIKSLSEKLFIHRIEPSLKGDMLGQRHSDIVTRMIQKMSQLLEIDINDDIHLKDSLLYHLPPMIYRLKNHYIVRNPLLNEIKKQYMVLFTLTWYATSILEQEYNIVLNDDEVSFFLIHFQVAIEKKYIQKNIVIVCDNGIATSELMLNKIMQILPYRDNVRTATKKEIEEADLSKIDFVITSVDLPKLDTEVIKVNRLINSNDINNIIEHYSRLSNDISSLKKSSSIKNEDFNRYFKEELIFVNKDFKTRDECLEFLINKYEKLNLVTPAFRKSIYDREALGDTTLHTGVCIPHANPETVLETRIAIVKLNHKIKWGNNPVEVDLIVLLGISEKDVKKIKNLIARILEIVDGNQSVELLHQVKNSREMKLKWRELI